MIEKRFMNPVGQEILKLKARTDYSIYLEDFSDLDRAFGLRVILEGDNSSVRIIGRAQTNGEMIKKWNIELIFKGKDQTGVLDLRGSGEGESLLVFDGSAILDSGSEAATVKISEKIILFDSARGSCLPVLKVKTDQVKLASHSASVSPMDSEILLFCQSRGLEGAVLNDLLKSGFLGI